MPQSHLRLALVAAAACSATAFVGTPPSLRGPPHRSARPCARRAAAAAPSAASGPVRVANAVTGAFPFLVLGGAVLGKAKPASLLWFSGCVTPALALTMMSMGATLSPADLKRVVSKGGVKPVAVGFASQFTVMPLAALAASRLFRLSPALTAGTILVGTCPGGTASNLVALIAGADVALSVAMTTASTVAAAVLTPALAAALIAGTAVRLDARALVASTAQVVLLPVALGALVAAKAPQAAKAVEPFAPATGVVLVALICGSVVASSAGTLAGGATAVPFGRLVGALASMHLVGFGLGYVLASLAGLPERARRTVSIEVGMQNSALAAVLAAASLGGGVACVPGAVSAVCHSVLGSGLASWWRRKGVGSEGNEVAS